MCAGVYIMGGGATCRVTVGERRGRVKKIRRITNNNNNSLSKTRMYIIVFRRRQDGTRGGRKKDKKEKKGTRHFHRIRRRSFMFERTHRPNDGALVQLRPRFFA